MSDYLTVVQAAIAEVGGGQQEPKTRAAALLTETVLAGGVIQAFGCGHSEALAMEIAGRAGGLVPTNRIALRDIVLYGGEPLEKLDDPAVERDPEIAHRLYDLAPIKPDDAFVIASNSGINGAVVEMALLVKQRGHKLIAITSAKHSAGVDSRHPSGRKLGEIADVVLDNGAPYGDAAHPAARRGSGRRGLVDHRRAAGPADRRRGGRQPARGGGHPAGLSVGQRARRQGTQRTDRGAVRRAHPPNCLGNVARIGREPTRMNPESQVRPYPTRRAVLQTAGTVAVAAPLLAGCVTAGKKDDTTAAAGAAKTADNPLGVKADAPLEVVVFKGGYGDEYATKAEAQYTQKHPKAKVDHKGLQKVGEAMQPRFVAGNPPDVVDNTGAGRLDIATLVNAKQVADLTDLLDAPAFDQSGRKVRDTLLPGVVDDGTFGGTPVALNFTYTVWVSGIRSRSSPSAGGRTRNPGTTWSRSARRSRSPVSRPGPTRANTRSTSTTRCSAWPPRSAGSTWSKRSTICNPAPGSRTG